MPFLRVRRIAYSRVPLRLACVNRRIEQAKDKPNNTLTYTMLD
jgi:hypothetical protein